MSRQKSAHNLAPSACDFLQGLCDALTDLRDDPTALTALGLGAGGLAIAPAALPVAGGLILIAKLISSFQANKTQQDIAQSLAEYQTDLSKLRTDQNYAVHIIRQLQRDKISLDDLHDRALEAVNPFLFLYEQNEVQSDSIKEAQTSLDSLSGALSSGMDSLFETLKKTASEQDQNLRLLEEILSSQIQDLQKYNAEQLGRIEKAQSLIPEAISAKLQSRFDNIQASLQDLGARVSEEHDQTRTKVEEEADRIIDTVRATHTRPTNIPHDLPPSADQFFGRSDERKALRERLKAGKNTSVVGPAGMGKTALAARALEDLFGPAHDPSKLAESLFPDGIVFLDLYSRSADCDLLWEDLANSLRGNSFEKDASPQHRATEACRNRRCLIIVEGAEEADGKKDRPSLSDLLQVLSPSNVRLILTRDSSQSIASERIALAEALSKEEAAKLFQSLAGEEISEQLRDDILALLEGHPLALTWAGNLLADGSEDPSYLYQEWTAAQNLPSLYQPDDQHHTLRWLFDRSVRSLPSETKAILNALGLLGREQVPLLLLSGLGTEDELRPQLKILVQRGLLRLADKGSWEFTHVLGYQFARRTSGSDEAQREALAKPLQGILRALTSEPPSSVIQALISQNLLHSTALLAADGPEQRLWLPLAEFILYDCREKLGERGNLTLVNQALFAVKDWFSAFSPETLEEPTWSRERSVLSSFRGNLAVARGNLDDASRFFQQAKDIAQRLAQADPDNSVSQRDLSVSLNKLGNLAVACGNLDDASRFFQQALEIRQRLAQADPDNSAWQRDLSVSLSKLGELAVARGNLDDASRFFQHAKDIAQRLAQADPDNSASQRDLSVSLDRLGDLAVARGNLDDASRFFQQALEIRQRLAQADPDNSARQRDLSVSLNNLGDLAVTRGNLDDASRFFQQQLDIAQRLAQADLDNSAWQRDLSVSLNKLGELAVARGNLDDASRFFQQDLDIAQRLAQADPDNSVSQRDLAVSHFKLYELAQKAEDQAASGEALASCYQVLAGMEQRGMHLDPPIAQLLQQLKAAFASSPDSAS